jgi:serine/threonine-protein kinase RsbW
LEERSDERVELGVPPKPEYVGTARIVVAAFARHHGFPEDQVDDLKIAVSEAVTNAIRAHVSHGVDDEVIVSIWVHRDELAIEVVDAGAGFEPEHDLGKTPAPGTLESGLGLTVIKSLFADAAFDRIPGNGMRIHISAKRESDPRGSLR